VREGSAATIMGRMNNAFALVEIHGFGDVGRNNGIVLMMFLDAIDLDGQCHLEALAL